MEKVTITLTAAEARGLLSILRERGEKLYAAYCHGSPANKKFFEVSYNRNKELIDAIEEGVYQ